MCVYIYIYICMYTDTYTHMALSETQLIRCTGRGVKESPTKPVGTACVKRSSSIDNAIVDFSRDDMIPNPWFLPPCFSFCCVVVPPQNWGSQDMLSIPLSFYISTSESLSVCVDVYLYLYTVYAVVTCEGGSRTQQDVLILSLAHILRHILLLPLVCLLLHY